MWKVVVLACTLRLLASASAGASFLCGGTPASFGPAARAIAGKATAIPATGTRNALIVFAGFPGDSGTVPEWAGGLLDPGLPGSIAHFYDDQSFGALRIRGEVAPRRYLVGSPASSYTASDSRTLGDIGAFVSEILKSVDGDVDLTGFDNDGPDGRPNSGDDDGAVDMLMIVTPALPPNFLLGPATGLASLGLVESFVSRDEGIAGAIWVSTGRGAVQVGRTFPETAGSIAHEMGHLLGLPDLYNTHWLQADDAGGPASDSGGIGRWGLMGWGALGWPGAAGPTSFSGWSRWRLGWNGTRTLDEPDQEIALEDAGSGGDLVVIPLSRGGAYVLEYRRRDGSYYDRGIPGEGLLVWHVAPILLSRVRLVCADGRWADAAYPQGVAPAPVDGGDNLDFWAHDESYAAAHAGNLGDGTDPFDGVRFGAFVPEGNPSSRTEGGLTPRIEDIRRDGDTMRARVRLDPPFLEVLSAYLVDETDDGVLEEGESARLRFWLENRGGTPARGVRVELSVPPELAATGLAIDHPDVPIDPVSTRPPIEAYPLFRLLEGTIGARLPTVTLRVTSGGTELGSHVVEIPTVAPRQEIVGVTVIDTAGNGDGTPQPAEIIQLSLTLRGQVEPLRVLRFQLRSLDDDVTLLSTGTLGLSEVADSMTRTEDTPEFLLPASLAAGRELRFELSVAGTYATWLDTVTAVAGAGRDATAPRVGLLRVQSTADELSFRVADRWVAEAGRTTAARALIRDGSGAAVARIALQRAADGWEGKWRGGSPGFYRVQIEVEDDAGNVGRSAERQATILMFGNGPDDAGAGGVRAVELPVDPLEARFSSVAVAPSDPRVWYASTHSALHRSDDSGETWRRTGLMHDGLLSNVALSVDCSDPNTVYVREFHDQLLISHDGGSEWERVSLPVGLGSMGFFVDRTVPGRVFASLEDGLLLSEDEGRTWQRIATSTARSQIVVSDAVDPDVIYRWEAIWNEEGLRLVESRMYWTLDRGASWDRLPMKAHITSLTPDPTARLTLFGTLEDAAVRTTDGGASWDTLDVEVSGLYWGMAFDFDGGLFLWPTWGSRVSLFSEDRGETWRETNLRVAAAQIAPGADGQFAARTYDRLYRGQVGGEVPASVVPLKDPDAPVGSISFAVDGSGAASSLSGSLRGVFRTGDGGKTWDWHSAGAARQGASVFDAIFHDPLVPDVLLAHTSFGMNAFSRSTDSGRTWKGVSLDVEGAGSAIGGSVLVRPTILPHPVREGEYLVGEFSVQRTRDFGATWEHLGPVDREFRLIFGFSAIGGLAVDTRDIGRIVASLGDSLWRSEDDGATWQLLGRIRRNEGVFGLAYHPAERARMYAATIGGLYVSVDDGLTWERRISPATGRWISARIRQHPQDADRAYLVTGRELHETRDGGDTWYSLHQEFGGLPWFNDVAASPVRADELFVATSWGLYRLSTDAVTAVAEDRGAIPTDFCLEQNYPNPFNAGTVIGFRIPSEGTVTLVVFDLLGQRVATVHRGDLPPGKHRVRWDGRSDSGHRVASGVYLYRLSGAGRAQTKKLLVLQ